ncbi:tRNA pseudouridine(38-40) synthase TruA [Aureibaculum sp. 2210JD6-5]|uniref:tRNA pseudouridine(38-40) synthase TruA n=1 Tax=Aureibaculum sp. 2210JD6-5 TaxID=3103957 RepID=UPI002AAEE4D8|nr:tRNA pseudouridine(38-40) synthase TruA [Aureibaculum sp. 2210JD6-5]MDY7394443.1 tRNA pseudouridine(38-40) synthase TruA [Aureibaculum sp. 2210JD6-5]
MRYFIELSYNGKNYHGWQIQPNAISVQEVLTKAFSTILRIDVDIVGAGRTDTGVHALQLFAHFDVDSILDGEDITRKINAFLPEDIVVKNVFSVEDDAHARFSATSRSYEYRIWLGRNPFLIDTTWQLYQKKLDLNKMNQAAAILLENTNFKCFSKSKTDVRTYNCKVMDAKWVKINNELTFCITADRFLRNMVRAIVGTLIEVGSGKKSIEDFIEILKSEDRRKAGVSAPPQGLFLSEVNYPKSIINKL